MTRSTNPGSTWAYAPLRSSRPRGGYAAGLNVEAITQRSRLLIVDAVVGPPNEDPQSEFLDLMMLVTAGGRERTEPEWRALLAEGRFRLERITSATPANHVIEAVPD